MRYTDPTGFFTEEAISEYIRDTYGEERHAEIWAAWSNDEGWWNMLLEAEAGDTLALIGSDRSVSWHYFDGIGTTTMAGIYNVSGPGALLKPGQSPMSGLQVHRARSGYALIGGLFFESHDTIKVRWYPKGEQQGKRGYFGTVHGITMHTVTGRGVLIQKGVAIVAGSTAGAGVAAITGPTLGGVVAGIVAAGITASAIETALSPYPVGTVSISLTVDLYGPGNKRNYDWYYGRYDIVTIGTPIRGGYDWQDSLAINHDNY